MQLPTNSFRDMMLHSHSLTLSLLVATAYLDIATWRNVPSVPAEATALAPPHSLKSTSVRVRISVMHRAFYSRQTDNVPMYNTIYSNIQYVNVNVIVLCSCCWPSCYCTDHKWESSSPRMHNDPGTKFCQISRCWDCWDPHLARTKRLWREDVGMPQPVNP